MAETGRETLSFWTSYFCERQEESYIQARGGFFGG